MKLKLTKGTTKPNLKELTEDIKYYLRNNDAVLIWKDKEDDTSWYNAEPINR